VFTEIHIIKAKVREAVLW